MGPNREKAPDTQGIKGLGAKGLAALGGWVIGAISIASNVSRVGADSGCLQWAGALALVPQDRCHQRAASEVTLMMSTGSRVA